MDLSFDALCHTQLATGYTIFHHICSTYLYIGILNQILDTQDGKVSTSRAILFFKSKYKGKAHLTLHAVKEVWSQLCRGQPALGVPDVLLVLFGTS
jgi:hypothetical protein